MGWFADHRDIEAKASAIAKDIKDKLKSMFRCPCCGNETFNRYDVYFFKPTLMKNIGFLVGEKTGVCYGGCGALCHGEPYVSGEGADVLTRIAMTNNQLVYDWLQRQVEIDKSGRAITEADFDEFAANIAGHIPDLFPKLNLRQFCIRCITFMNENA